MASRPRKPSILRNFIKSKAKRAPVKRTRRSRISSYVFSVAPTRPSTLEHRKVDIPAQCIDEDIINEGEEDRSSENETGQRSYSSMVDLLETVKRVLSIQELRQAEYNKLRRVHGDYTSHTLTLSDYQKAMAEITTAFQLLSQETIQLSAVIQDHPLPAAAQVLDRIQAVEKIKLTLTAEWQVLVAAEIEIGDEEFDQAEHTHKQKTLRQKLARVEGEIAELVQDFRYECEHILVSALDS